jgi:hypothetical protein
MINDPDSRLDTYRLRITDDLSRSNTGHFEISFSLRTTDSRDFASTERDIIALAAWLTERNQLDGTQHNDIEITRSTIANSRYDNQPF